MKAGLKDIAEKMSIPPNIIRSDEEIERLENEIRQERQIANQMEALKQGSQSVESASKADLNVSQANE